MTSQRLTGGRCQCPRCGDYFGSVRGFDRHRIGPVGSANRRCMTAGEMDAAAWARDARGFLLTPDPRRAGVEVQGPGATLPPTHAPGAPQ